MKSVGEADDGMWSVDLLRNAWVDSDDTLQLDAPTLHVWVQGDHYLTPDEARKLAEAVLRGVRELTPARSDYLRGFEGPLNAINEAHGTSHTLESLAAECGVDLAGPRRPTSIGWPATSAGR